MDELLDQIRILRVAKGWDQTDTPEILAKSIVVEAAELLACYMTKKVNLTDVQSELADVLMYALALCQDLNLDPTQVVTSKFADINHRYPDRR